MMDTVGVVLGVISLVIAIIAEIRSVKLKRAYDYNISVIKVTNELIIKYAYEESSGSSTKRLHAIQGVAETQKTLINGFKGLLKLNILNLWDMPKNDA